MTKTNKQRNSKVLPVAKRRPTMTTTEPQRINLQSVSQKQRDFHLMPLVKLIIQHQEKCKRKSDMRGIISKVVNDNKVLMPWINYDLLKKRVQRYKKHLIKVNNVKSNRLTKPPQPPPEEAMVIDVPTPAPGQSPSTTTAETETQPTRNKGGRKSCIF